jgi:hypothetical protein
MKDGGYEVITAPHVVIFSAGRGKCWVWRTGRFTPRKKAPLFVGYGARWGHSVCLETLKREKILSSTKIHSTTARLSSHYRIYCTNWAIRCNKYEFIWLSGIFISCRFGVNLIAKNLFLWFYLQSTKTLRPFKRFFCNCTGRETLCEGP